jgi:hypothetical protein
MDTIKKAAPFFAVMLLGALVCVAPAFGQTAEKLDAVLDAERVSFAQAAAIVLPAAGLLSPEAGPDEAFARAREWLPHRAERDSTITLGELSHLVMRSFSLSGGFMYALFPGPRYAYRALAWRRLLPPGSDPGRFLTGEELLYITGRVLSLTGDAEPLAEAASPVFEEVPAVSAEDSTPEEAARRLEVEQGQGLSSGPERALSYEEEFEIE